MMGENNSRLILKPHPVFESRNVYKIPKRNFNYTKQTTTKKKTHWIIVTKLSQYERICKITQKHFFLRDRKKPSDMDMFLEMKLTKSPSTEDGVKTSQMLWGYTITECY